MDMLSLFHVCSWIYFTLILSFIFVLSLKKAEGWFRKSLLSSSEQEKAKTTGQI